MTPTISDKHWLVVGFGWMLLRFIELMALRGSARSRYTVEER
jgi:hypothetical protein